MEEPIYISYNGVEYGAFKKCPKWLKDAFRRAVKYRCQDCSKHEEEVGTLEIHRPRRGVDGGLYVCVPLNHPISNAKVLCNSCHSRYNYSPKVRVL